MIHKCDAFRCAICQVNVVWVNFELVTISFFDVVRYELANERIAFGVASVGADRVPYAFLVFYNSLGCVVTQGARPVNEIGKSHTR